MTHTAPAGQQPHASRERRDHAVVIGASMGGLCAAAALAPHFARVTLVERDALPAAAEHRRGVPQSKHTHGFQPGGLRALDDLLPGFVTELVAAGAPRGDVGTQTSFTVGGSRFARDHIGGDTIGITRPFLEHRLRDRVAALPNVTIRDRVQAGGLVTEDRRRITGVHVAPDGGATPGETVTADLVVDASGKGSRLPRWLADLGYDEPAEDRVECRMAYLSRRWRLAPGRDGDVIRVVTPAAQPHFGVVAAQEDGTHIVTLGGLLDAAPARGDAACLAFARALPDPVIADALDGAVPVTEYQTAHFPASVRRRYDRMRDFPSGLLAIGDAIAAFNPMYGQGMAVAALEARELRDQLARGPLQPKQFFRAAHRIEDVAWKIATGGDLRYPGVVGKRTPGQKFMNGYLDRLTAGARHDPVLARQFMLVAGFIKPPQSFFAPRIVRRVLRAKRASSVSERTSVARDAGIEPVTPAVG